MSKKLVALVLAFALVFSTFATAFAGEALPVDAQAAVTIGMLQGDSSAGVTNQYLTTAPDRLQAAIMYLRLKGLEQEALAYTSTVNFADASEEAWQGGRNVMAYLKAHPELGWQGKGGNLFDPNKDMEAQDYYKVMLEALGYKQNTAEVVGDFTYAGIFEFAADLGLSKVAGVTNFTVADLATATIEALKAEVKGSTKTLAASLVEAGVIDVQAAVAAGIYTVAPTTLAVESVDTNNVKTIVVKFNKEVKDTTVTNDTVKVYEGTTKLATTKVLAEDNKTLYVYATTGTFSQMKNHKVVINGVASKENADEKVSAYEVTINVADTTAPVLENVVATSPKTLELYFNEPVQFGTTAQVYSSLKIDNVNTYVSNVDVAEYYTTGKIVVTLGTALSVGNHTVKVSGVNDFANFPVAATEFTLVIAADTVAPKVVEASMRDVNTIRVVFDEPVDSASVANTDFDVDGTANTVTNAVRIDAKTYDLTLGTALGKAALVEVLVQYKGIKDFYGNQDTANQSFTFKVADDAAAPALVGYAVTSTNTIELTFSEDVANFDITDIDLFDEDNEIVTIAGTVTGKVIDGVTSKSVYVVDLTTKASLSGAYTVKFDANQNITDLSIRANKFVGVNTSVVLNDLAAPTITAVEFVDETTNDGVIDDSDAFDAKLTVYFSEAMDAATIANAGNYIFGNTVVSTMTNVTTTVANDNKSVTFVVNGTSEFAFSGKNIYVLAVKDASGITLDAADMNVAQIPVAFASTDSFANLINKVEATSKNTLKVTMEAGKLISSIDPNKITFVDASTNVAIPQLQVMGVSIASDAKSAVLTLNNNLTEDAKYNTASVELTALENAIVLNTTQGLAATAADADAAQIVTDKIVPTVNTIAVQADSGVGNNVIVVDFNEAVTTTANTIYDITVVDITDNNTELVPGTDFTLTNVGGDIQIVISKTGLVNHKFSVSIDNGRFITDGASNTTSVVGATVVENAAGTGDALINN